MPQCFNKFYTEVGTKIDAKIPHSSKHYTDYMDNINIPPITLKLVTETEINNIIKKLSVSGLWANQHT